VRISLVFATAIVMCSCGPTFTPASRLTDFRLLAVQADSPYAAPGETVHFQTLFYEPFGRNVTWAWAACIAPPDTTAVGCLDALARQSAAGDPPEFAIGVGMNGWATTIPADVLSGISESAWPNISVGIVTVACPGNLTIGDFESLSKGRLPFSCIDAQTGEPLAGDRFAVSVRHVYVRTRDRNANPVVAALDWNDGGWPEGQPTQAPACDVSDDVFGDCPASDQQISLQAGPGAVETGTDQFGMPFSEQLVVQYYSTEGSFQQEDRTLETPATGWEPGAAGTVMVVAVLRDDRGGVGWTTRSVEVH
jgi:hypothetical protein